MGTPIFYNMIPNLDDHLIIWWYTPSSDKPGNPTGGKTIPAQTVLRITFADIKAPDQDLIPGPN